jgi:hypothetical protein
VCVCVFVDSIVLQGNAYALQVMVVVAIVAMLQCGFGLGLGCLDVEFILT